MDKQIDKDINVRSKMIEEMAEYIFGNAITHDTQFKEDCRSIARDLICVGYRKIPEDGVVLTREEYELFDTVKKGFPHAMSGLAEKYSEIGQTARIRTAKWFAEMLKERLEERKKICLERWKRYEKEGETDLACYWNGKENEIYCVKSDIYEICKIITEVE